MANMPATVDNSARDLIEQHGTGAVYAAVERLNQSIDEGDQLLGISGRRWFMQYTNTSGR
jgi:hypothetical protein